jgi:hypothetical protein
MAIDTSVSPYFDDYSESKNFHKVLYKPGVAVQARELNQSQTILQNQIKRVGDFLFTEGQKVTGAKPSVNVDARTVRILSKDATGATVTMSNFLGKYVTGKTSSVVGLVEFVFEKNDPVIGELPSIVISLKRFNETNNGVFPEKEILYFYDTITEAYNKTSPALTAVVEQNVIKNATSTTSTYSKIVTINNASTLIEVGDLLVHPRITKQIRVVAVNSAVEIEVDNAPGVEIASENIQYTKQSSCPTLIVIQDIAYYYKSGYLVRTDLQKIVPDKNTDKPSKVIGFYVNESVITSSDDTTLLDPAIGSSNYYAPGADRLQINLSLASFDLTASGKPDTTEKLIPLLTFQKGQVQYVSDVGVESELRKEMELRSYDQSGNYVVDNFIISPATTPESSNVLYFNVSGGKAYVGGKLVATTSSTELKVPRPSVTETKTGYNITTSQGNYLLVTDVNYMGSGIIPRPDNLTQGEMFLEMHNVTNPTAANAANTRVGTLVFKNLEYDSSLGANSVTQLKLFYHYFNIVKEAPATWVDWSTKYKIPAADGQYIANVFFSSPSANTFLGNYGVASTPCYALYREPGVDEVAYWYRQWSNIDNKDIAKTKKSFAEYYLKDTSTTDYTRLTSSAKSFYSVINGSPFADGLLNVNQVRSIVGVNNASTSHYTAATYAAPFFYANISQNGVNAVNNLVVFDPRDSDALIFPIGTKRYLKSVNKIRTTYTRVIKSAIFSGGVYTKTLSYPESFNLGDGTVVASTARTNFLISVKSGATSTVKNGIFNFEQGSVTISSDSTIARFDLGDAGFSGVADIEMLVQSDNVSPRKKTLVKDSSQFVNITTPDLEYSLKISDIAAFTGVYKLTNNSLFTGAWDPATTYNYNQLALKDGILYKATVPSANITPQFANAWSRVNTSISQYFVLSDGQKDGWYDHGSIKYIGATAGNPGNVLITYDYFTHSGDGPCTVDSYPSTYYRNIPVYRSTITARNYNLRDCLDFRPKRINGSQYLNFETGVFPTSSVNTDADITYYLGRVDKLYISKDIVNFDTPYDRLFLDTGTDTASPITKETFDDKSRLAIATLIVPPYAGTSFDVKIVYEDNRRFTMQDIAKIEKTTVALDKAIKVQAVEIANLKSIIVNDNGDTLLKSGILVENFTDFTKADLTNPSYNIAISTSERACYPLYSAKTLQLAITKASNFSLWNDLMTAKYEEEVFITQTDVNSSVNPNPGGIDDRRGRATLSKRNSYSLNLLQWGLIAISSYGLYTAAAAYIGGATASASVAAGWNAATGVVESTASWIATQAQTAYSAVTSWISGGTAAVEAGTGVTTTAISTAGEITTSTLPAIEAAAGDAMAETGVYNVTVNLTEAGVTDYAVADVASTTYVDAAIADYEASTIAAEGASWWSSASTAVAEYIPYVAVAIAVYAIVDAIAPGVTKALGQAVNWVGNQVEKAANWVGNKIEQAGNALQDVWDWAFSDIRMKEEITFVSKIKPGINLYTFRYKKPFRHLAGAGPGLCYGLMAQEVEKIYPDAIRIESNGYKSINYSLIGI